METFRPVKKSSTAIVTEILRGANLGLSYREIGVKLGIHHQTVSRYARGAGIPPLKRKWPKPIRLEDGRLECPKCNLAYEEKDFPLQRPKNLEPYRLRICKYCRNSRSREVLRKDENSFFKDRQARVKQRAKKEGIEFNLPAGFLSEMWRAQGGRCFYTDNELLFTPTNRSSSISVDRVNTLLGYDVGNVVLCLVRANTIKTDMTQEEFKVWMPTWYERSLRAREMNALVMKGLGEKKDE